MAGMEVKSNATLHLYAANELNALALSAHDIIEDIKNKLISNSCTYKLFKSLYSLIM